MLSAILLYLCLPWILLITIEHLLSIFWAFAEHLLSISVFLGIPQSSFWVLLEFLWSSFRIPRSENQNSTLRPYREPTTKRFQSKEYSCEMFYDRYPMWAFPENSLRQIGTKLFWIQLIWKIRQPVQSGHVQMVKRSMVFPFAISLYVESWIKVIYYTIAYM